MTDAADLYSRQRREFALLLGLAWVVYGLVFITTYPYSTDVIEWLPTGRIGSDLLGAYFVTFGAASALLACLSEGHPALERAAYGVLFGAPLVITMSFFCGALLGYVPTGWSTGTRMLMMAGIAYYMGGLKPSDEEIARASPTTEEDADGC